MSSNVWTAALNTPLVISDELAFDGYSLNAVDGSLVVSGMQEVPDKYGDMHQKNFVSATQIDPARAQAIIAMSPKERAVAMKALLEEPGMAGQLTKPDVLKHIETSGSPVKDMETHGAGRYAAVEKIHVDTGARLGAQILIDENRGVTGVTTTVGDLPAKNSSGMSFEAPSGKSMMEGFKDSFRGAASIVPAVGVAGYALFNGATPAEAAVEGLKEIDGVEPILLAAEGEITQSIEVGKEQLNAAPATIVGTAVGVVTGVATGALMGVAAGPAGMVGGAIGGVAGSLGYNMMPEMVGQADRSQFAHFDRVYDTMGKVDPKDPSLPPEIVGLKELHTAIERGQTALQDAQYQGKGFEAISKAETQLATVQEMYTQEYDTLMSNGSMAHVDSYLQERAQTMQAPDNRPDPGGGSPVMVSKATFAPSM